MDKTINKYVAVAYKLYATADGKTELVEEATEEKPFQFITGFGITLDEFEKQVYGLEQGEAFDFILTKEQAYGDFEQERVLNLDKSMFSINGHFDNDNIYKDAIVPLQNEDGNRFFGHVLEVTDDKVTMDLNHPLAGMELNFKGKIVESREATNREIEGMVSRLSGEGCSCGCGGGCGGGCGHDHDKDGGHECCGHGGGECHGEHDHGHGGCHGGHGHGHDGEGGCCHHRH